jgi:hypothetical protein
MSSIILNILMPVTTSAERKIGTAPNKKVAGEDWIPVFTGMTKKRDCHGIRGMPRKDKEQLRNNLSFT